MEETITSKLVRVCPACHQPAYGDYCMYCGEKIYHETITLPFLIRHIPDLFDIEHGIVYTMRSMLIKPGKELRRYFLGNRSRHYKPLKYVLFLGGVSSIINSFVFQYDDRDLFFDLRANPDLVDLANFINQWYGLLMMLVFPLLALISWRFYKKKPYTYGEHLIAQAFLVGQFTLVNVITTPLRVLRDDSIYQNVHTFSMLLFFGYAVYYYADWIYEKKSFGRIVRSIGLTILIYIIGLFTFLLWGGVFFYIGGGANQ
jgi:hypothetical protein